jgi:DNA-directed RNA polymerase alpha subunit
MTTKPTSNMNSNLPEGLAQPALRALAGKNITRLEDLTRFSEAEIKKLHGIGPTSLKKLKAALDEKGLSYA